VQWASKVIKFSSDLGGKQFGIKRILGKPDVFPQGGYSGNAWTPKKALDGSEIIEVGFENSQLVKQVAVFENLNAGCVVKISVSTDGEHYETVWTRKSDYRTPSYKATLQGDRAYYFGRKRRKVSEVPNVFNPGVEYAVLDHAVANVKSVKVEFNFALLPGQKQIDAIGISDSSEPIEAKINSRAALEQLANASKLDLGETNYAIPCVAENGTKLFTSHFENNKEYVVSFTKENGKWTNKKVESELSATGENYNYVEHANAQFVLKGGTMYTRGTNDCGFELFENNAGIYNSLGQLKIAAFNNYEDYSDVTITADGKVLVMALETDFTQGGIDLYFTTKKKMALMVFFKIWAK